MGEGKTGRLKCAGCGKEQRDGETFWKHNGKWYCLSCYVELTGEDPYREYYEYYEGDEEPDWLEENWWFKVIASG
ncbi:MAG: hypothetical protein DRP01_08560 [Archaeoglobales archaeon]|nr:MAG: hypothetical protein DRP01_08560 [Archaeoglobales archaeon]